MELLVPAFPHASRASWHHCSKAKARLLKTVAACAVMGSARSRGDKASVEKCSG